MAQIEQSTITSGLFCPACGYYLRGIESERCPECGLAIDRATIGLSVIPWTHRKRIGRFRAFWRTVEMAVRSPGKLAQDVARPVSYRDAQLFRWIVVLVAALPLCAVATYGGLAIGEMPMAGLAPGWGLPAPMSPALDVLVCIVAGVSNWYVPSLAILLLIAGLTGAGSYWFGPNSIPIVRQNRAIAVSYYGCAPLALLVIPYVALAGAAFLAANKSASDSRWFMVWASLMLVAGTALPLILIAWWHGTLKMLAAATNCSTTRVLAAAICLPVMWLIVGVLAFGVFPAICGFIRLMILSYTG